MKRVRITNERVNSYGFRVLTDGVDTGQYERNPVLLYMHQRGQIIGYVKDLKKENGEITGEPVFDCATELSKQCKKQYEFGSLRMVSAGLDPRETSDANELIAEGQTRPTVTKCKLVEVSMVDIGANDDATVLMRDGQRINLSDGGECILPLLNQDNNNNNQKQEEMELKTIALQLGLPETADEAAVMAKLAEMKNNQAKVETLEAESAKLTLANITAIVDGAIREKKINADQKDKFIELGKKVGGEELKGVFAAMSPQVKLSGIVGHGAAAEPEKAEWKKLSEVPADKLVKLKAENPAEYHRLYKAEYGFDF